MKFLFDQFDNLRKSGLVRPKTVATLHHFLLRHGYGHSVQYIANSIGLSPRHLNRCLKTEIGLTAGEFIRWHRCTRIRKYMREGKVSSLTRLAYEFDYYDQAHFIREFKRFSGQTPGAYLEALSSTDRRL